VHPVAVWQKVETGENNLLLFFYSYFMTFCVILVILHNSS